MAAAAARRRGPALKKCARTAKICALLCALATLVIVVNNWPDVQKMSGNRVVKWISPAPSDWQAGDRWAEAQATDLEQQVAAGEALVLPGLGEGGAPAELPGAARALCGDSQEGAMNVYISDRIAYNRSVGDRRNPACRHMLYDAVLPSASVVITFRDEPYSALLRTVWSVVASARRDHAWYRLHRGGDDRTVGYPGQDPSSQLVYLKEIILVDDNSTLPELKGQLSHYVRTRLPPNLVRIRRLPERVGLPRARLVGARAAAGSVLVFLDAHCEAQPDWLRPLLQRVQDAPRAVVAPLTDHIHAGTYKYTPRGTPDFEVGGFTFKGASTWIEVSEREKQRRGSDIAPTRSPTMVGGLFAVSRAYYLQLGANDDQAQPWGGELLEMSFKVWQCGGTLEVVPCSRVGHVDRSCRPYGPPAPADDYDINTARMAEVWMDDYKELFYLHRPDLRNSSKVGDVSPGRQLRQNLRCRSFEWYLQHVFPEQFVPVRDAFGYGRFRNPETGLCLDTLRSPHMPSPLAVFACHESREPYADSQHFTLTKTGQLRDDTRCVVFRKISVANVKSWSRPPRAEVAGLLARWGDRLLLALDSCRRAGPNQ
ncbi:polypeptide N-acetylgalactosaminyltransferase 1-like, partial [Pectinophora gossypiella]|uniref:polypeptide N-acetylgalactosaminyltransferase 1-like n=1 Tax=Pectinophora gossypiella TaxID=13191 RepID=UPI00214E93C3